MTAGLYSARARLKTLLVERLSPGGQVLTTDRVENYPGFPDGVSGFELVQRMKTQAEGFGLTIQNEEVIGFELAGTEKKVITDGGTLQARTLILACGATWKKAEIEGEGILTGKGVSYCATCDGPLYRDEEVAVIGGGDTAMEEAIFLTRFAGKVYLIHRRERLKATRLLQERAMAEKKIEFVWDTVPTRILGQDGVEGIEMRNVKTGTLTRKTVRGIFIFIGTVPNTELIRGIINLDNNGFIITDQNMETSVPGVFAAGDVRSKLFRQITTAVGDGATASFAAERYLENLHESGVKGYG